jgi:hypothetical protein
MPLSYLDMHYHVTALKAAGPFFSEETRHMDHHSCEAGKDTKRRFYVTKNYSGDYLCYCQHCGQGGLYSDKKEKPFHESVSVVDGTSLFDDMLKDWELAYKDVSSWKDSMKLWWYSHEFDEEDADLYNIRASRTLLYVFCGGECIISRNFSGAGPKYIRTQRKTFRGWLSFLKDTTMPTYVVEDVLSALKLHKAGHNALCLLGTKMSASLHSLIVKSAPKKTTPLILWLDNDMAGMHGAKTIYTNLSPHRNILVIKNDLEPKETPLSKLIDPLYMTSLVGKSYV